jgi:hypothetical protein
MKSVILGAVAVAAVAVFGMGSASAADGSELMAQCKANAEKAPAGTDTKPMIGFCQCLVDEAGDDQSVIDEHLAIMQATSPEEMQAKAEASSDKAKEEAQSCMKASGMSPPPGQQ